jgi:Arc/MetJ-type ribon-helix-helix transcriptional regulator
MTYRNTMPKSKIAITIEERTLARLDRLVREALFPNRSQAIQEAVEEKLERLDRVRLARESARLDPDFEKALAEEGLSEDLSAWPEY